MKLFLVGGDRRQQYLQENFRAEGFFTYSFGLFKEDSKEKFLEKLQMEYAPTVLLPLPSTKDSQHIFAPQCLSPLSFETLLAHLHGPARILGFSIPKTWCQMARDRGFIIEDLYHEAVKIGNAKLTAAGAMQLLQSILKEPLLKKHVAILGFGRIGKELFSLLEPYAKETSLFLRNETMRASLQIQGKRAFSMDALEQELPQMDVLFNTVPSPILTTSLLEKTKENSILIELASSPFGFSLEEAKKMGRTAILAGGLPGKYYPMEASAILLEQFQKALPKEEM